MPLDPVQTMLSSDAFAAMGTINRVVVEDPCALTRAMEIVRAEIDAIDRTCSRFREDSELSRLNRGPGDEIAELSPLLEEAMIAALSTAEMTDGLVDPTVGGCVEDIGYRITFLDMPADGPALDFQVRHVVGWRALAHDPIAHTIRVPAGVLLDLGASGKAWAADRAAAAVAGQLGVSVAVECGGDMAVGGPLPAGGWPVRVGANLDSGEWQDVAISDGGLATSGTSCRRWRRGGVEFHHIIDPRTGLPARTPWVAVSVAAATCVEANAAATAALILGDAGPAWLDSLRLPGRLVDHDGGVIQTGGWLAPDR